jgi:hypothetical protein
MNENLLTIPNVVFALGIIGTIFTVYNYFKDPQISGEKKDALLAQQVQWQIEGTERRFKEIQESFNGLLLQSNNHIHTVETKVDAQTCTIAAMGIEIAKLTTIIEERIPKK